MACDSYNPAEISERDAADALARVARYVRRHGSEYGETPVPGGDMEEAVQVIAADWQGADWAALELTYWERNGRLLFSPDLSDMGRHLRAVLFMAGRARRRGWVEAGPMRRAARQEGRRRDMDDSPGAGMASRAADPARLVAAVEAVERSGFSVTPVLESRRRLRWVKTRNSSAWIIHVTRRPGAMLDDEGRVTYPEGASTGIELERVTRFNFRQAGDTPNRALPKTRKRLPEGVTAGQMMEALTGKQ